MADPSKVILLISLTHCPPLNVRKLLACKRLRYMNTLTQVLKMYFKVNCLGAARADLFDFRYILFCVSLWMKISYTNLEVVKYK